MELIKKAEKYLIKGKNLEKLLLVEKRRRGIDKDNICFIAAANLAQYWWCDIKAYLRSKQDEIEFFGAYLYDKISYAEELGLIENLPKDKGKWLDIGNKITLKNINMLLKEKHNGICERIYNEDPEKVEDKFLRGNIYEFKLAEKYPKIRWHFTWGNYVIEGIPDGITDKFVYEFKSTKSKWLSFYTKPVALTQADLYGYFFKREKKRVQIYLMDKKEVETIEDKVDINRALKTLRLFEKVCNGKGIRGTSKKWKCKVCEFKEKCIKESSK